MDTGRFKVDIFTHEIKVNGEHVPEDNGIYVHNRGLQPIRCLWNFRFVR